MRSPWTAPVPGRPRVLRRLLVTVGLLPALVALVALGKVVVMMSHDEDGRTAFGAAEFTAAAEEYRANRTWNWFEPWIAPFDEGAARHADGSYDAAMGLYEQALETVPGVEECTVRINLALANEALGDLAAQDTPEDPGLAGQYWRAGIDALAAGGCPQESGRGAGQTAAAEDVDRRLREKLQQQADQQQDRPGQGEQPPDENGSRQQELEERNDQGRQERRDQQDQDGEGGGGPQGGAGGTPQPGW